MTSHTTSIDTPDFLKKASKYNRHTTCSVLELRKAALRYFQTVHPLMVKSKVVSKFEEKGWNVLFTPPYCPDIQPIELFWAAGKNWARYLNPAHTRTIEECIKDLRAGWYGDEIKDAADCRELIRHSIDEANKRVDFDEYLTGTVEGGLAVADGCEFTTRIDEMGRGTRMMMKYFADCDDVFPVSAVTDTGLRVMMKFWLME